MELNRPSLFLLPVALAAACQAGGDNAAPYADAGPDQVGAAGFAVTLDGSGSQDTDDSGALTYHWQVERAPEGSQAEDGAFSPNGSADAVTTAFTPDVEGLFVVRLTVNDGVLDGPSDFVMVDVDVSAMVPVADAGADQSVTEGDVVTLDGSASADPLGGELGWAWTLVTVPERSSLVADSLAGAETAHPTFTPDAPGQYLASLVVTSAVGEGIPDFVAVSVSTTNEPPVASIDTVNDGWTCSLVGVTGSSSTDPDGDPLTYDWRLMLAPFGSDLGELPFDDATSVSPFFEPDLPGEYLLQLVVNDGEQDSAPARYFMDVVPRPDNEAPVAKAGSDKFYDDTVTCTAGSCPDCEDKVVALNALDEGSYDPDGDPVTYEWKVLEGDATVLDPTSPETTVTLDQADAHEGSDEYYLYKLQLVMTDCLGTTNDLANPDSIVSFTYQCTGE